jgi:hypothetical protein
MRKSGGRFVIWQSARGLAQSKTLRVFQGIIVSRAASWSAVARHRFCHRHAVAMLDSGLGPVMMDL